MKKAILLLFICCSVLTYGQKGDVQLSVIGGYEKFTSVYTPLSYGNFLQLDVKSYITNRIFLASSLSYGFLNNEKKELVYNPYNQALDPVELPRNTQGKNVYAGTGVGIDFLNLVDGMHRFYAFAQGGFVHLKRSNKFWEYKEGESKPIHYDFGRGPEFSFLGGLTLGYDFYIIENLSIGLAGAFYSGSFGDIPTVGLRIGYTFN